LALTKAATSLFYRHWLPLAAEGLRLEDIVRDLARTWSPMEKDLINWINSSKRSDLQSCNSFQAIPGFPTDGFRSDALLTDRASLLAVEVEVSQSHPDTNVGKYWLLHDEYFKYQEIVLFHIYTPAFDSYGYRRKLGSFYFQKMKDKVPIEYHELEIPAEKDYDTALSEMKSVIRDAALRLFGPSAL
jgi:hypothetical protein